MKSIRQTIIEDGCLIDLLHKGELYVSDIRTAHQDVSTAQKIVTDFELNGLSTTKARLEEIEAVIAIEVASDTTLSNDAKRKAAIRSRLSEHPDFQKLQSDLAKQMRTKANLEQDIQLAKIGYERAVNRFNMWRDMMRVCAGLSGETAVTPRVKEVE